MVLLLFLLFGMFSIVIFYLCHQFDREQKGFQKRIDLLQQTIVDLNQKAMLQNRKIQLTEELEKTLQSSRPKLGNMIFNLNYDLFDLLSQNNLLQSKK